MNYYNCIVGKAQLWLRGVSELSPLQRILVFVFSIILYVACGFEEQGVFYQALIQPDASSNGNVKVVFYDPHYDEYLRSGSLRLPESGWTVTRGSDSTTLTAASGALPISVFAKEQPIEVSLLRYVNGGVANIADSRGVSKLIPLTSTAESIEKVVIGGPDSNVASSSPGKKFPLYLRGLLFALIAVSLLLLATVHRILPLQCSEKRPLLRRRDILYFSVPLFLSTSIVCLSFWPGNVAYDGSLQWYQAVTRGYIDVPLGVTATLFLRLFSYFSKNPALVILIQSSLSAIGTALVLKELCVIGVPRWVATLTASLIALTPQYALFFTTLGKDALSATGLIFFTWSLLRCSRKIKHNELTLISIFFLVSSATFASLMRANVLPAVSLVVLCFCVFLFMKGKRILSLKAALVFLLLVAFMPKISFRISDEAQIVKNDGGAGAKIIASDKGLPFGLFGNFYIYHLFSAAQNSGILLDSKDEKLFFQIAPRNSWKNYSCEMSDTTFTSVSDGMLMTQTEYTNFLKDHQLDLALSVINIIRKNPEVLMERQLCITKMLWYIGYGQKPFQTTATLGYDNVTKEFKNYAGENRSLLYKPVRSAIQRYVLWTESYANFWLFWKPALLLYIGLFCVLIRLASRREAGLSFALALPLLLIAVLLIVIPFPAYRYAYPATLIMTLLGTVSFCGLRVPPLPIIKSVSTERVRSFWVDACRSSAIFGVLIIHSCGPLFYKYNSIATLDWLFINFWDSLARVSVPLFVMLSGSLLLESSDSVVVKPQQFFKRVLKVLIPLISWSVFYLWWIDLNKPLKVIIPEEWIGSLLDKPVVYHLWFVFMIIGLYSILPILQVIYNVCKVNPRFKSYFLIFWMVSNSVVIYIPMKWIDSLQIIPVLGFGGYFVAGALLNNSKLVDVASFKWVILYLFGSITTFLVTWWFTYTSGVPSELAYSYFSFNVVLASVGAFMAMRRLRLPNRTVAKIFKQVSEASFFIYFVHVLMLEIFQSGNFGINLTSLQLYPGLGIPLTAAMIFLVCLFIAQFAKLIPHSRKFVG